MLTELRDIAEIFGNSLQSITYSASFRGRTKTITVKLYTESPKRKVPARQA